MIPDFLFIPTLALAFLAATILIISWDWRISIFCLAIQYICVFVLVSMSWPLETAAVKLVAGWIACAVMGLALLNLPRESINGNPKLLSDIIFRLLAAILAGLFAFTGGANLEIWLPEVTVPQAFGSMILIALGLLHSHYIYHLIAYLL